MWRWLWRSWLFFSPFFGLLFGVESRLAATLVKGAPCCAVQFQHRVDIRIVTLSSASDSSVPFLLWCGRLMADRASGAAWQRRQRRLRSWWRHEQQTVATVLATVTDIRTPRRPLRTPSYGDRRLAAAPRWDLPSSLSSRRTMAGPRQG